MPTRRRELLVLIVAVVLVYGAMQWLRGHRQDGQVQELAQLVGPGDLIMYSTQSCGYCVKARQVFESNNVAFSECDIDHSTDCMARFRALGGLGTPTFELRGERVVGWSLDELTQAAKRTASTQQRL